MGFGASISRVFCKMGMFAVKNADKIMLIGGMASVGVGTGLLIKNADKISDVTERVKADRDTLKTIDEDSDGWKDMDQTRRQFIVSTAKDHAIGYLKAVGPGVGCIIVGEVLQGASHAVLAKRYQIINTALAGTAAAFTKYRNNVVADQGAEKDKQYLTEDLTAGKYISVQQDQDGTVTTTETPLHPNGDNRTYIPHSFWLSEMTSLNDPDMNNGSVTMAIDDLRRGVAYCNQELEVKGFIFENKIRERCFAPMTIAGQTAGIEYNSHTCTTIDLIDTSTGLSIFDDNIYATKPNDDILFEIIVKNVDETDRHETVSRVDENLLLKMDQTEEIIDPMNPFKKVIASKFGWKRV